jgi:hypothetical protein
VAEQLNGRNTIPNRKAARTFTFAIPSTFQDGALDGPTVSPCPLLISRSCAACCCWGIANRPLGDLRTGVDGGRIIGSLNVKILNISGPTDGSGDKLPSHHAIRAARLRVSPQTARTLAILGACGAVLWVMLSVSGYLHEEPRVALQQARPLMVVALPR